MSLKSPEAVKYFSSFDQRVNQDSQEEELQLRESKICRIATNKLQYMSLKHIVGRSTKA